MTKQMIALLAISGLTGVAVAEGQSRRDHRRDARQHDARAADLLRREMDGLRNGVGTTGPTQLAEQLGVAGLSVLPSYLFDDSSTVRSTAAAITAEIALTAKGEDRAVAGRLLVDFATDADTAVARAALRGLDHFVASEFDLETHATIARFLNMGKPTASLLLVAGIVGSEQSIPRLQKIHKMWLTEGDPSKLKGLGWHTELALARLGEPAQLAQAIGRVSAIVDIYQRAKQMDSLQYIRHADVVPVILVVLNSDEPYRNFGDHVELQPSKHAATALSKMFSDFPMPRRIPEFSTAEIEQLREWANGRSEWQIRR